MPMSDDLLDDLFHGCALAAFIERAAIEQALPHPDTTRQLAYRLYEAELARKHDTHSN